MRDVDEGAPEGRPNRRAHPKNTKRSCRGVRGREHVTEVLLPANAISRDCKIPDEDGTSRYDWEVGCHHVEQCLDCGKHIRPFLNRGECPTRLITPATGGNDE